MGYPKFAKTSFDNCCSLNSQYTYSSLASWSCQSHQFSGYRTDNSCFSDGYYGNTDFSECEECRRYFVNSKPQLLRCPTCSLVISKSEPNCKPYQLVGTSLAQLVSIKNVAVCRSTSVETKNSIWSKVSSGIKTIPSLIVKKVESFPRRKQLGYGTNRKKKAPGTVHSVKKIGSKSSNKAKSKTSLFNTKLKKTRGSKKGHKISKTSLKRKNKSKSKVKIKSSIKDNAILATKSSQASNKTVHNKADKKGKTTKNPEVKDEIDSNKPCVDCKCVPRKNVPCTKFEFNDTCCGACTDCKCTLATEQPDCKCTPAIKQTDCKYTPATKQTDYKYGPATKQTDYKYGPAAKQSDCQAKIDKILAELRKLDGDESSDKDKSNKQIEPEPDESSTEKSSTEKSEGESEEEEECEEEGEEEPEEEKKEEVHDEDEDERKTTVKEEAPPGRGWHSKIVIPKKRTRFDLMFRRRPPCKKKIKALMGASKAIAKAKPEVSCLEMFCKKKKDEDKDKDKDKEDEYEDEDGEDKIYTYEECNRLNKFGTRIFQAKILEIPDWEATWNPVNPSIKKPLSAGQNGVYGSEKPQSIHVFDDLKVLAIPEGGPTAARTKRWYTIEEEEALRKVMCEGDVLDETTGLIKTADDIRIEKYLKQNIKELIEGKVRPPKPPPTDSVATQTSMIICQECYSPKAIQTDPVEEGEEECEGDEEENEHIYESVEKSTGKEKLPPSISIQTSYTINAVELKKTTIKEQGCDCQLLTSKYDELLPSSVKLPMPCVELPAPSIEPCIKLPLPCVEEPVQSLKLPVPYVKSPESCVNIPVLSYEGIELQTSLSFCCCPPRKEQYKVAHLHIISASNLESLQTTCPQTEKLKISSNFVKSRQVFPPYAQYLEQFTDKQSICSNLAKPKKDNLPISQFIQTKSSCTDKKSIDSNQIKSKTQIFRPSNTKLSQTEENPNTKYSFLKSKRAYPSDSLMVQTDSIKSKGASPSNSTTAQTDFVKSKGGNPSDSTTVQTDSVKSKGFSRSNSTTVQTDSVKSKGVSPLNATTVQTEPVKSKRASPLDTTIVQTEDEQNISLGSETSKVATPPGTIILQSDNKQKISSDSKKCKKACFPKKPCRTKKQKCLKGKTKKTLSLKTLQTKSSTTVKPKTTSKFTSTDDPYISSGSVKTTPSEFVIQTENEQKISSGSEISKNSSSIDSEIIQNEDDQQTSSDTPTDNEIIQTEDDQKITINSPKSEEIIFKSIDVPKAKSSSESKEKSIKPLSPETSSKIKKKTELCIETSKINKLTLTTRENNESETLSLCFCSKEHKHGCRCPPITTCPGIGGTTVTCSSNSDGQRNRCLCLPKPSEVKSSNTDITLLTKQDPEFSIVTPGESMKANDTNKVQTSISFCSCPERKVVDECSCLPMTRCTGLGKTQASCFSDSEVPKRKCNCLAKTKSQSQVTPREAKITLKRKLENDGRPISKSNAETVETRSLDQEEQNEKQTKITLIENQDSKITVITSKNNEVTVMSRKMDGKTTSSLEQKKSDAFCSPPEQNENDATCSPPISLMKPPKISKFFQSPVSKYKRKPKKFTSPLEITKEPRKCVCSPKRKVMMKSLLAPDAPECRIQTCGHSSINQTPSSFFIYPLEQNKIDGCCSPLISKSNHPSISKCRLPLVSNCCPAPKGICSTPSKNKYPALGEPQPFSLDSEAQLKKCFPQPLSNCYPPPISKHCLAPTSKCYPPPKRKQSDSRKTNLRCSSSIKKQREKCSRPPKQKKKPIKSQESEISLVNSDSEERKKSNCHPPKPKATLIKNQESEMSAICSENNEMVIMSSQEINKYQTHSSICCYPPGQNKNNGCCSTPISKCSTPPKSKGSDSNNTKLLENNVDVCCSPLKNKCCHAPKSKCKTPSSMCCYPPGQNKNNECCSPPISKCCHLPKSKCSDSRNTKLLYSSDLGKQIEGCCRALNRKETLLESRESETALQTTNNNTTIVKTSQENYKIDTSPSLCYLRPDQNKIDVCCSPALSKCIPLPKSVCQTPCSMCSPTKNIECCSPPISKCCHSPKSKCSDSRNIKLRHTSDLGEQTKGCCHASKTKETLIKSQETANNNKIIVKASQETNKFQTSSPLCCHSPDRNKNDRCCSLPTTKLCLPPKRKYLESRKIIGNSYQENIKSQETSSLCYNRPDQNNDDGCCSSPKSKCCLPRKQNCSDLNKTKLPCSTDTDQKKKRCCYSSKVKLTVLDTQDSEISLRNSDKIQTSSTLCCCPPNQNENDKCCAAPKRKCCLSPNSKCSDSKKIKSPCCSDSEEHTKKCCHQLKHKVTIMKNQESDISLQISDSNKIVVKSCEENNKIQADSSSCYCAPEQNKNDKCCAPPKSKCSNSRKTKSPCSSDSEEHIKRCCRSPKHKVTIIKSQESEMALQSSDNNKIFGNSHEESKKIQAHSSLCCCTPGQNKNERCCAQSKIVCCPPPKSKCSDSRKTKLPCSSELEKHIKRCCRPQKHKVTILESQESETLLQTSDDNNNVIAKSSEENIKIQTHSSLCCCPPDQNENDTCFASPESNCCRPQINKCSTLKKTKLPSPSNSKDQIQICCRPLKHKVTIMESQESEMSLPNSCNEKIYVPYCLDSEEQKKSCCYLTKRKVTLIDSPDSEMSLHNSNNNRCCPPPKSKCCYVPKSICTTLFKNKVPCSSDSEIQIKKYCHPTVIKCCLPPKNKCAALGEIKVPSSSDSEEQMNKYCLQPISNYCPVAKRKCPALGKTRVPCSSDSEIQIKKCFPPPKSKCSALEKTKKRSCLNLEEPIKRCCFSPKPKETLLSLPTSDNTNNRLRKENDKIQTSCCRHSGQNQNDRCCFSPMSKCHHQLIRKCCPLLKNKEESIGLSSSDSEERSERCCSATKSKQNKIESTTKTNVQLETSKQHVNDIILQTSLSICNCPPKIIIETNSNSCSKSEIMLALEGWQEPRFPKEFSESNYEYIQKGVRRHKKCRNIIYDDNYKCESDDKAMITSENPWDPLYEADMSKNYCKEMRPTTRKKKVDITWETKQAEQQTDEDEEDNAIYRGGRETIDSENKKRKSSYSEVMLALEHSSSFMQEKGIDANQYRYCRSDELAEPADDLYDDPVLMTDLKDDYCKSVTNSKTNTDSSSLSSIINQYRKKYLCNTRLKTVDEGSNTIEKFNENEDVSSKKLCRADELLEPMPYTGDIPNFPESAKTKAKDKEIYKKRKYIPPCFADDFAIIDDIPDENLKIYDKNNNYCEIPNSTNSIIKKIHRRYKLMGTLRQNNTYNVGTSTCRADEKLADLQDMGGVNKLIEEAIKKDRAKHYCQRKMIDLLTSNQKKDLKEKGYSLTRLNKPITIKQKRALRKHGFDSEDLDQEITPDQIKVLLETSSDPKINRPLGLKIAKRHKEINRQLNEIKDIEKKELEYLDLFTDEEIQTILAADKAHEILDAIEKEKISRLNKWDQLWTKHWTKYGKDDVFKENHSCTSKENREVNTQVGRFLDWEWMMKTDKDKRKKRPIQGDKLRDISRRQNNKMNENTKPFIPRSQRIKCGADTILKYKKPICNFDPEIPDCPECEQLPEEVEEEQVELEEDLEDEEVFEGTSKLLAKAKKKR